MAENSNIEWTDHTFNPWVGCSKVSAGCKHCYAETLMDKRYGRVQWGPNGTRVRTSEANWKLPLRWNKKAREAGVRHRVFCASLSDVFESGEELIPWRQDLFKLIEATPHLDWLLLTKRPENIVGMWNGGGQWDKKFDNVWLGTSVEHQAAANDRIHHLLKAAHLCRYTFLSCEPLLGSVNLQHIYWICGGSAVSVNPLTGTRNNGNGMRVLMGGPSKYPHINWVIAGGESGTHARPMHPDWARSLRDQCAAAGVPFLFKQWGEWSTACTDASTGLPSFRQFRYFEQWVNKADTWVSGGICLDKNGKQLHNGRDFMEARDTDAFPVTIMHRIGKKAAGRLLDGVEHNAFPA